MNRRDFLKCFTSTSIAFTLPVELSATLTIVDWKLLDGWESLIKMSSIKSNIMTATIDTKGVWDYLRLIDSEGREWNSIDEGQTWICGLMEFSLEER